MESITYHLLTLLTSKKYNFKIKKYYFKIKNYNFKGDWIEKVMRAENGIHYEDSSHHSLLRLVPAFNSIKPEFLSEWNFFEHVAVFY